MVTSTKDKSALMLIGFIGFFIIGSMILLIIFAFTGTGDGSGENVWAGLFSLTTAILGAVGGYLGGTAMEARKHEPNASVVDIFEEDRYEPKHGNELGAFDTGWLVAGAALVIIICGIVWLIQAT
jgi:heme/copper-type cytochrome/quinol oxidase subunit 4